MPQALAAAPERHQQSPGVLGRLVGRLITDGPPHRHQQEEATKTLDAQELLKLPEGRALAQSVAFTMRVAPNQPNRRAVWRSGLWLWYNVALL